MRTFFVVAVVLGIAVPASAASQFASSMTDPGLSTATLSFAPGGTIAPPGTMTATTPVIPGSYTAVVDFLFAQGANFNGVPGSPDVKIYLGAIGFNPYVVSIGLSQDGTTYTTESIPPAVASLTGLSGAVWSYKFTRSRPPSRWTSSGPVRRSR